MYIQAAAKRPSTAVKTPIPVKVLDYVSKAFEEYKAEIICLVDLGLKTSFDTAFVDLAQMAVSLHPTGRVVKGVCAAYKKYNDCESHACTALNL